MFVGKARAYSSDAPFMCSTGTNALAYYKNLYLTAVKCFITSVSDLIKSIGLLSYSVFGGDVNVLCPHGAAFKEDLEKEEKIKKTEPFFFLFVAPILIIIIKTT
jgi:hypothetical protein